MKPLISTEELSSELGGSDLVVLDATMYLPNENKRAPSGIHAGAYPGCPVLRHR